MLSLFFKTFQLSQFIISQTNVLTVNHITWLATQRGRTMNIRPLVNQMLVTEQEANHLKDLFKQIMDSRTAAVTKSCRS